MTSPFDRPAMPAAPAPRPPGRQRVSTYTARLPEDVHATMTELAGQRGTKSAVLVALVRWIAEPAQAEMRALLVQRAEQYTADNRRR